MPREDYSSYVHKIKDTFDQMKKEIHQVIIGQDDVIDQVLVGILCDGNVLLESYPGLGKTMLCKTIAKILDLDFSRIQCTPDLMPSDIIGTYVIQERSGKKEFQFQKGPVFANIVLADEINRATPKTQAALLEAMQEKQVTVGNETFELEKPFFVLATQNPIDMEGTYPLPEAQIDRFLLKVKVDYPLPEEEFGILEKYTTDKDIAKVRKLMSGDSLRYLQNLVRQVPIANDLKKRVLGIVVSTRKYKEWIEFGASPRATIGLIIAAKAHALINGRHHVSNTDIDAMAYPVLRHRIILNFKAEKEGKSPDEVISDILKKIS